VVAAAHQSEVDFSAGVVAAVSPGADGIRDQGFETRSLWLSSSAGADGQREDGAFAGAGERFGGEIVSCDSVAVYRGMELGTAKPTAKSGRACRII
jgi:hypothetical protein